MTRRYPDLPNKTLRRDSEIVKKIVHAWDTEKRPAKVLAIFLKERDHLSDERYWEILRSVWVIAGAIENAPLFRTLMTTKKKRSRHYFSTPEEAAKLREMPESFDVYRATNDANDGGLSWTTNYDYAVRYAKDYSKEMVISMKVHKSDVFAYIERNNESEIIIL